VVDELPSPAGTGDTVPIELTPISVGIVPNGDAGIIAVDDIAVVDADGAGTADIVGVAEIDGIVPVESPAPDIEVTGTDVPPDTICGIGVAQVTYVPGVAGLEASGTGASVVSGVSGWVVAENGPGPVSGDVTITPGVVGIPMAVVPMVETCARLTLQPNTRAAAVNS
jgi:hypothetical protein